MDSPNIVSLRKAVICVACQAISDSHGDTCLACGSTGGLLSLSRILNPSPELGRLTYIWAGHETEYSLAVHSLLTGEAVISVQELNPESWD